MTELAKPYIVCAACRSTTLNLVVAGARHFDVIMRNQINALGHADNGGKAEDDILTLYWHTHWSQADQGFIDQFGKFYERDEALAVARENEKDGRKLRNPDARVDLYSEDLY